MKIASEIAIEKLQRALLVITLDKRIKAWLLENDPKAYEQATQALNTSGLGAPIANMQVQPPIHFCCCGNPNCKMQVKSYDKGLLFTDKTGQEHYMYLGASAILDLMTDLRHTLDNLVKEATRGEIL